jgi:hypothetical protein
MSRQLNGNQILVGQTSDLNYGLSPSNANLPGVLSTDKLSDAIDKIAGVLDRLAPAKSPSLYTKYLSLIGTFHSARHVATGSTAGNTIWLSSSTQSTATASEIYNYVYFGTNPVVRVADSATENSNLATFSDGQFGYLQADIDFVSIIQKNLDSTYHPQYDNTSVDIGTWGDVLTINFDADPYLYPPDSGFWTSLKATMSGSQSFVSGTEWDGVEHTYQMSHLITGSTPVFQFICDNGNATPPTSLSGSPYFTVITQSSTKWISGIPSLQIGDIVSASYSVNNTISGGSYPLISRFYNSTGITRFELSAIEQSFKYDLENGIPVIGGTSAIPHAYQPVWSVQGLTVSVISDMYDDDAWFSFRTYNPANISSVISTAYNIGGFGASAGQKLYIDTISDESSRSRSGNGQFPNYGTGSYQFGEQYSPTYSMISIYGTISSVSGEMMLQGGYYKYPTGDYTVNYPVAGYTYSTLYHDPLAYGTYRWATFNIGSITNKSAVRLLLNGTTGINDLIQSGMLLYITVVNSGTQVIGWIDANSPWVAGIPSVNGDSALVIANSTAANRYITFGGTTRTGDVWVRIGFPSVSSMKFSSITYQSV